jgi:hypothetical protein
VSTPPRQDLAGAPAAPPQAPGEQGPTYLSHRQILVVLGGVMSGMLLAALDQSIVGTACRGSSASWAGWTSCRGS